MTRTLRIFPRTNANVEWDALSLFDGMSCGAHAVAVGDYRIRRLTPTECARLQTIPEWYRWGCSEAQQYKMLGNGWTVEAIKHILSFTRQIPAEITR